MRPAIRAVLLASAFFCFLDAAAEPNATVVASTLSEQVVQLAGPERALSDDHWYMWKAAIGPCTIEGNCVRSPNFPSPYDNKQKCTIEIDVAVSSAIGVQSWNVESTYDKLFVNGQQYDGRTVGGPEGQVPTTSITWTSDHSVTATGWQLCDMTTTTRTSVTTATNTTISQSSGTTSHTGTTSSTISTVTQTHTSSATQSTISWTTQTSSSSTATSDTETITTITGITTTGTISTSASGTTTSVTETTTATSLMTRTVTTASVTATASSETSTSSSITTESEATSTVTVTSTTFTWPRTSHPEERFDFAKVSFSVILTLWPRSGQEFAKVAIQLGIAKMLGIPETRLRFLGTEVSEVRPARRRLEPNMLRQLSGRSDAIVVEVHLELPSANMNEASQYEWRLEWISGDDGMPFFLAAVEAELHSLGLSDVSIDNVDVSVAEVLCPCPLGYGRAVSCRDECSRCQSNEIGGASGVCKVCPDGTQPSGSKGQCQECAPDSAGTSGMCGRCHEGSEPNAERTACQNEEGWLGLTDSEWTALGVVAGVLGVLLTLGGYGCWSRFHQAAAEVARDAGRHITASASPRTMHSSMSSMAESRASVSTRASRSSAASTESRERAIINEVSRHISPMYDLSEDDKEDLVLAFEYFRSQRSSTIGARSPVSGSPVPLSEVALSPSPRTRSSRTSRPQLPVLLADGRATPSPRLHGESGDWTERSSWPDLGSTADGVPAVSPSGSAGRAAYPGGVETPSRLSKDSLLRTTSEPSVVELEKEQAGPGCRHQGKEDTFAV